jgi:transcription initiation factor IIE alpha subunit
MKHMKSNYGLLCTVNDNFFYKFLEQTKLLFMLKNCENNEKMMENHKVLIFINGQSI